VALTGKSGDGGGVVTVVHRLTGRRSSTGTAVDFDGGLVFVCICDTVCVKLGIELGALINVAVDFDGGLVFVCICDTVYVKLGIELGALINVESAPPSQRRC